MNTVMKYVIRLDLLNCNVKFRGYTICRSREMTLEIAIGGNFGHLRTEIVTSAVGGQM